MDLEQVYRENIGMVERCAAKLCRQQKCGHLFDDLISAGTEALLEHAPEYREGKGTNLSTFLYPHVRGAMKREIELLLGANKTPKREFERRGVRLSISWEGELEKAEKALQAEYSFPKSKPAHLEAQEKMVLELIGEEFQKLSFREREILGGRYEVFGYEKQTLSDLAEEFQITEDAVLKAAIRAMDKLRALCLNGKPQELRRAFSAVFDAAEEFSSSPC